MNDDLSPGSAALDGEAYDWVMRFARGHAGPADLASLKQWAALSPAHAAAFARVSGAWKALGPVGRTLPQDVAVAVRPARSNASAGRRIGRRTVLGGALAVSAAGVAVLGARPPLGLWPSWTELAADHRTRPGEQRQIVLAGHVAVDLNTRTSLVVRADAEAELVAGEVMIAVRSGQPRPFALLAGNGRIVAADAGFNVRIDDRGVCITCIAGEVAIERQAAQLRLPAGRQVVYSDHGIGSMQTIDTAIVAAWRDGVVIFQSTPVREVVAEVNRYRGGRIILTSQTLGERLFNARLRVENIDRVVDQIEQTFGARVTRLPGDIVLLG